jgi:hypothetical protein
MANYNKSFNFRNGVQVDNDNFIVNANGLVGIGTTIPTQFLDVYGAAKFNSPINATDITLSGLTSSARLLVNSISIQSGIITSTSGIVTYYGDGGNLLNLPTSQWIDVDSGLGYTSIYAAGNVGIATANPSYTFQVGNNPDTNSGVGFNSTGSIKASGIITAYSFSGFGTSIDGINASNISNGTLNNSRLPQNISVSGIVTASTRFVGNLTGNVNSTGLSTFSGGIVGNVTGNINSSGLSTFSGGIVGNVTGNINSSGLSTFSGGIVGNLTGNVNSTGLSTFSGGIVGNVTGNVNSTGLSTFSGGIVGNLTGNVTGIASTARSLTGTPDIVVGFITATNISVGTGGTIFSALTSGRIGIGTAIPTSDLQIRKNSNSLLEVISNSNEAKISIGQSVGVGKSTAVLRFGNQAKTFDIINYDTGNINSYLHAGPAGVGTGKFAWLYGQTNTELACLTYDGKFAIGTIYPTDTLHVYGTSRFTGLSYFEDDVQIQGNLTAPNLSLPPVLTNINVNSTTGVSTFFVLDVTGRLSVPFIGIGTTAPIAGLDARGKVGLFDSIGIGTTSPGVNLKVNGSTALTSVSIGETTDYTSNGVDIFEGTTRIFGGTTILSSNIVTGINSSAIILDNTCSIGVGTTSIRSAVDFGSAGLSDPEFRFMIVPTIDNTIRTGLSTEPGSIIFNTSTNKFQGYTGIAWTDFH